ncbi:hypothetical protein [Mycobacterium sp.]|uniref:hypothetical protein n=1 Tax=Mycobacterium sp. TaxID=1785 RepID=UPI0012059DB8|nr:hypothetical protein [Mycobacterium sp.]TAM68097.1 MAG: hypothetical protein EPN51_12355 [Mycobacterium sp.]
MSRKFWRQPFRCPLHALAERYARATLLAGIDAAPHMAEIAQSVARADRLLLHAGFQSLQRHRLHAVIINAVTAAAPA